MVHRMPALAQHVGDPLVALDRQVRVTGVCAQRSDLAVARPDLEDARTLARAVVDPVAEQAAALTPLQGHPGRHPGALSVVLVDRQLQSACRRARHPATMPVDCDHRVMAIAMDHATVQACTELSRNSGTVAAAQSCTQGSTSTMRSVLRNLVEALPTSLAHRAHAVKHRLYWLTRGHQAHRLYFAQYHTRGPIIKQVLDRASGRTAPLRVLEFGCSGRNNLRLLRERHSTGPIDYLGLDIQREAIEFGRSQFPDARFEIADDRRLVSPESHWGRWDVFLASGVLSYIPEERVAAVLRTAARFADFIVVCDELSRFDSSSGIDAGVFLHPYGLLCKESGLHVAQRPTQLERHRYGIFCAVPERHG